MGLPGSKELLKFIQEYTHPALESGAKIIEHNN